MNEHDMQAFLLALSDLMQDRARRLLVEPEQTKLHDGPCRGGPLDGSSMAWGADVFKSWGGEYQWIELTGVWVWFDTDPDLTTFGELGGPAWFELAGDHYWEDDRIRLLTQDGVVYDDEGFERCVENAEPVRRLPKPEWSK